MRKTLAILAAVFAVLGFGGYAAGIFTEDTGQRESCQICRATRYVGRRYGFPFEKIEDTAMTGWYRSAMDSEHGRTPAHAHIWQPSGCPVYAAPGVGDLEAACPSISPIFLLKPETEMAALQAAPDNRTRRALIDALNVQDRRVALDRVKLIVEYVYVQQPHTTWTAWWQRYAGAFGMHSNLRPIALRKRSRSEGA